VVTFGDEANGTGLTLHPGQKLILRLPGESPSTGYGWRILGGLGPHVKLIDRTAVSDLPPPPPGQPAMAGGGGTAVYRFVAERPGPALLRLGLFPPGHGRPVARVFRLRVTVAAVQ
jgi:predicted secreted protein